MYQAILTSEGTVVTHKTLCKLQNTELACEYNKRKHNLFDDVIEKKLGSSRYYLEKPIPKIYISYEDNSEEAPP